MRRQKKRAEARSAPRDPWSTGHPARRGIGARAHDVGPALSVSPRSCRWLLVRRKGRSQTQLPDAEWAPLLTNLAWVRIPHRDPRQTAALPENRSPSSCVPDEKKLAVLANIARLWTGRSSRISRGRSRSRWSWHDRCRESSARQSMRHLARRHASDFASCSTRHLRRWLIALMCGSAIAEQLRVVVIIPSPISSASPTSRTSSPRDRRLFLVGDGTTTISAGWTIHPPHALGNPSARHSRRPPRSPQFAARGRRGRVSRDRSWGEVESLKDAERLSSRVQPNVRLDNAFSLLVDPTCWFCCTSQPRRSSRSPFRRSCVLKTKNEADPACRTRTMRRAHDAPWSTPEHCVARRAIGWTPSAVLLITCAFS